MSQRARRQWRLSPRAGGGNKWHCELRADCFGSAAGTIRSFLIDIAEHTSEYRPGTLEYLQVNQAIDLALTAVLWETQEISEFGPENEPGYGQIEVKLDGLANFYLERRQRRQTAQAKQ